MITRLRDAFDKAVRSAEDRQVHAGILGRIAEDGTYQIFVSERKEFVYVRTGSRGDRGVITARNRGVSAAFGLPVLYREDLDGHWALIGVDGMRLRGFTGGDAISTYNTPYHTHRTGSGLEYVQESRWFGLGRVALSSGLTVSIGSFRYPTSHDSWDTYGGGTLDLTASLPSAGKWVWVMVAIDPATNTETAISDTTEYDTQAELTVARIDDVDVEDYIPLAAVQLTSTDTTIPYSRFYEARFFLTNMPTLDQVGNPHADKTFTMATRTVTWRFTNPAGGMKWEWTGAASGHLWELNQNTGNPGAGTHLAHIEAEDADVLELHLDHVGDNAQHEFMRLQLDRATPTDNDEIRQAWYFDHDGAVTVQGEAEFARLGVIAEDVSEDSEDGAFAFSVMIAGALTEKARINATGLGIGTETPAEELDLGAAGARIIFTGTAGGGEEGILYNDAGGSGRYALFFPGSDIVALSNRASNGTVQIRANTSTAGADGEVTAIIVEDNEVQLLPSGGQVGIGTETPAVRLDLVSGPTTDSQVHIGEALDEGGWLLSTVDSQLMFTGGAQYVSGSWTARSTTASGINVSQGQIAFYTDDSLVDGNTFTPTQRVIIDPDGQVGIGTETPAEELDLGAAGARIIFTGTAGGGEEGILYNDAGGSGRYALFFPGSDIVALSNRASNGTVQIRANTSTAGAGGEVTAIIVEDNEVQLLPSGGQVGIGTAPQGLLHSYRNGGGMIHWTATGIAGTSQTILPNGTGDVTGVMQLNYAVKTSTGGVNSGIRQLTPGSTYNVYSSGADILTLTCAADGSVSIARSGGSLTYTASLHFVWV